jgi:transcriptional regulator with XRE-family HTH domain
MHESDQMRQINSYIAKQVRKARIEIRLTQSDLGEILNRDRSTIWEKEHNNNYWHAAELAIIAQATDKPIQWFYPPNDGE